MTHYTAMTFEWTLENEYLEIENGNVAFGCSNFCLKICFESENVS